MAWTDKHPYDFNDKRQSIQVLVFDKLKPIKEITDDQWNVQIRGLASQLKSPTKGNLAKIVNCIALVWGVLDQKKHHNESMAEVVKAVTSFVPSLDPAGVGDLISMVAEITKDYVSSYREALGSTYAGSTLSQEQKAILGFLNLEAWKDKTVAQWAAELLNIGEFAISSAQFGGSTKGVNQVNVEALWEYMRSVRPMLYLYRRDFGTTQMTSLR